VRRSVMTGAAIAALLLPAGAVVATSPPDTDPVETTTVETEVVETTTVEDPEATTAVTAADDTASMVTTADTEAPDAVPTEAAAVYDDSGNQVAEITLVNSEQTWGGYEEGNDPDGGNEYLRVTILVESLITDGTFNINLDQFILQDNNGFVTEAENVETAEQAASDDEITTEAELANGESVEFAITFQVVSSVGPQSMFYRPEDDRLVDVAEFG